MMFIMYHADRSTQYTNLHYALRIALTFDALWGRNRHGFISHLPLASTSPSRHDNQRSFPSHRRRKAVSSDRLHEFDSRREWTRLQFHSNRL